MKKGYLKLKFRNYIGIVIGLLFLASALVPVRSYPLESTVNVESPSQFISYFPFIVALTSIIASLFLALKFRNYLGIAVGLLFIASALVPIGGYHLRSSDVPVRGILWNFMVPTGWFYLIIGIVLLFHKRLGLENKRLAFIMFAAGLLFFPLLVRQNVDYWLGLWRGVTGDYDVESFGFLKLMLYFPFCVALTSMLASLLVITLRATETKESAEGVR